MPKKKEQHLRFRFNSKENVGTDNKGRIRCDFCYHKFVLPEVDVTFHGFSICPSCLQWGPKFAADSAKRIAGDKPRLATWGEAPEDMAGIAKEYLVVEKLLRPLGSFADISGGYVAIAIAYAPPNDPRLPHGGLRPKDIPRNLRRKAA